MTELRLVKGADYGNANVDPVESLLRFGNPASHNTTKLDRR